jgi:hypothetical protein
MLRCNFFNWGVALDLDIENMNGVQISRGQMSGSCGASIVDLLSLRSRANRYQKSFGFRVAPAAQFRLLWGATARELAVLLK